ncbi:helix-turn-helix transcriptional regulator [Streptomyces antimicrobicus]|uniref:Helix-turn-helix transcriptional regulator n=1 Tax=Streptomyces antimicrobicus TaxID=2883108 RepID=A0ABS8B328_9ACTN|nr:helix-turn-helix transcriptional regulator [Streptomyces antimicrobicus]MCB5179014.1 helix-turn-helix transcriptional regulator [Streptomyces antimicrobicus]
MSDLQDVDVDVYGWVLEHRTVTADAVAAGTGLRPQEAAESVERLLAAQLLHLSPTDPSVAFAVAPETAASRQAAPLEERIREHQREISRIREDLDRFAPHYLRRRSTGEALEVIHHLEDVRSALNKASENCRFEVLSSQPGGGSRYPAAMQEAIRRDEVMLRRGISMRCLYHHTARFNGPSQAYAMAISALGAEYRTAHELFGRLIVFDRELAFIPVRDGSWGAVVIREPSTVAYLVDVFEQAWDHATPFQSPNGQDLAEVAREIHETIIRLLAAGLKDEAIARRLGMSLRTARRHIADIMEELGAGSRFQAGVAAATRGLLNAAGAPGEASGRASGEGPSDTPGEGVAHVPGEGSARVPGEPSAGVPGEPCAGVPGGD